MVNPSLQYSFIWGFAVTCVPGGYLSYRNGFKAVMGIGVLANSLSTTLSPFAIGGSFPALIVCRCIAGAAEGIVMPAGNVFFFAVFFFVKQQKKSIKKGREKSICSCLEIFLIVFSNPKKKNISQLIQ